jgi:hypothetical protein
MNRVILTAVVCVAVVCGLTAAEAPATNAASGKPKIKFDQTVYDFGKTSQVEKVSGTFVFRNVGDADLKMGKPTTSCGCTVAGVKPEVLKPGEKGELSFSLNLGRNKATLVKQITVECNDPDSPKTVLTVKADYTPLYEITPVNFYFTLHKGDKTNVTARVTRTDGKSFTVTKVKPTQTWIEATSEPDTSSTTPAVRITATLKPDGTPRYFTEFVNAFIDNSDQPAFNVTLSGRLLGDLSLTPESLYWPITDPDKALTKKTIIVKSSLADSLEVKNVSSTLKDLTLEVVPKEDGKTAEVVAKLTGVPDKTTNGVIRFETNVPSQPRVEVPVWINIVKPMPRPAVKPQ